MPLIEFTYNHAIHSSSSYSPFEIVYSFNPLTILDLMPLLLSDLVSLDRESKAEKVKTTHMNARDMIEKKNKDTTQRVHKGRKHIVFEPRD